MQEYRQKLSLQRVLGLRFLSLVITIFLSTWLIFVLVRLSPGDPVQILMGAPSDMPLMDTPEYMAKVSELRADLGLDQNIFVQYGQWIKRLLRFDMGYSIYTGQPVGEELLKRLPCTLLLSLSALGIQCLLGVVGGVLSALYKDRKTDSSIRAICVLLASVPGFVIALALLAYFAVYHPIYEISSSGRLERLWLPAVTLALVGAPQLIRIIRAMMLSEFGKIYIVAALAKGLPRRKIVLHALRNILIPVTTVLSLMFSTLIGGSVIIESIFTWPGVGEYALVSILRHDYPVVQGYAVITVFLVILVNLLTDILYVIFDPQIGRRRMEK